VLAVNFASTLRINLASCRIGPNSIHHIYQATSRDVPDTLKLQRLRADNTLDLSTGRTEISQLVHMQYSASQLLVSLRWRLFSTVKNSWIDTFSSQYFPSPPAFSPCFPHLETWMPPLDYALHPHIPALQRAQKVTAHLYNTDYYITKLNRSTSSVYSSTLYSFIYYCYFCCIDI